MEIECTLNNKELVEKVKEWVSRLCKSGGAEWRLHVPVSFNSDPDMLITELCKRFEELSTPSPTGRTAGEIIMTKDLLIHVFKEVSLLDLSGCEFETNNDEEVCWANAVKNGVVIDGIEWDGNIFRMMDNGGYFHPLNPMVTAFRALEAYKNTPQQEEYHHATAAMIDSIKERLTESMADLLDNESTKLDEAIGLLYDPTGREESELHIRMATAALNEYIKTMRSRKKTPQV